MSSASSDFLNLLEKSKDILILPAATATDDMLASAFGLSHFLQTQQKKVSLLLTEPLPDRLSFLNRPDNIITSLAGARDFVLLFNTRHNRILHVKTEQSEDQYQIRITPELGTIDPRDFSFVPADYRYDLVVLIGAATLEDLGTLYQQNADLFFEIPKINIDIHSNNELFAQVNLVDITASSCAEMLAGILLASFADAMNRSIAQALLTGIIAATESFQKPNTTPKAMITAAQLMKHQADQQTIIRHLYKTKSLPFLKLVGRVMARLNWNPENHLVWSQITLDDLVQSRATVADVPLVLDHIQENFSEANVFALLFPDTPGSVQALLRFTHEAFAQRAGTLFEQTPEQKTLRVSFPQTTLDQAEKELLSKLIALD